MGFSVDPDAVAALSKQLERLQDHAIQGTSYVGNHSEIDFSGEGLINLISGGHREVQQQVENFLDRLANRTAATTAESLIDAARYYRSTDADSAARLDASYPEVDAGAAGRAPEEVSAQAGAFEDVADPTGHYRPPADYSDRMAYEPGWTDYAGPSSAARSLIMTLTGNDIFEEILKPVCGDWAGMAATAEVWRNAAAATSDMGDNVRRSAQGLAEVWQGNAADGCQAHLLELARALEAATGALESLGDQYEAAAEGAQDLRDALGPVVADAADAALKAGASMGISGLAAKTGVGLPVALVVGAFAASRIYRVISLLRQAYDLIGRLEAAQDAFNSMANDFGRVDGSLPLPELPAEAPALPSPQT
ncbi:hypothetical protein [Haloechinothrix sp. LS1_15]|uniref:WXG100 family type VII secretion target n=1 Tax=Haloechinothrix sp. LS1_15 TaxID=2652248 RepID=UPI0029482996|nr:hypothetical protein [Haloechinothrix sp. LS1_15]MDV6014422.1 hypothetical protein [Haloechinothrix sp. LS1_15]